MTVSNEVILFHDGRRRTGTTRSRLPEHCQLSRFTPGVLPQQEETADAVQEIATRCAPWLKVYLGPRLWSVAYSDTDSNLSCRANTKRLIDGSIAYEHLGLACTNGGDAILVAASIRMPAVISTLHHELWHMLERHLAPDDMDVVNSSIERGESRSGYYLASPIERRARAYESWASAYDEGWRPATICGVIVSRLDRIFSYVHSGDLATELMAGEQVRSRTFPGARIARESLAWPFPMVWCFGAAAYGILAR